MSKVSVTISCFILICVASVAMATPAITSQTWTFSDANNPAYPTSLSNAFGTPTATLSTTGDTSLFGWEIEYYGRDGVWYGDPLGITLIIPNQPGTGDYKEIWLTMDFIGTVDIPITITPFPGGGTVSIIDQDISDADPDGWKTLDIGWKITPNPNEEKICISVFGTGGFVDYITVDTACVPEPATLALLGLGTLVLIKRKRK